MQEMQDGRDIAELKKRIETIEEEEVFTAQLQPNEWNFNRMSREELNAVIESIRRFGRIYPCVVRALDGNKYEIIDGEHRWLAHCHLDLDKIKIKNLGRVSDRIAEELTLILNETRGEPNLKRLSELVVWFAEREGVENVMKKLPYDPYQFRDLLKVNEMNLEGLQEEWKKKFPYKGVISVRERTEKCDHEWEEFEVFQCDRCKLIVDKIVEST